MKKVLILIFTMLAMSSCALWEQQSVEILYAPRLLSKAMSDDELAGIRDVTFFTFNSSGVLVGDTVLLADQLRNSKEEIIIVKGLVDGDYKTVGFANLRRSEVWGYERSQSTADQLFVKIRESVPMDSLHYNNGMYRLARGVNVYATGEFSPRYYDMELVVRGLSALTVPLVDPTFELRGVPTCLDVEGEWKSGFSLNYAPELGAQGDDVLSASCTISRFTDESDARLVINTAKGVVQDVALCPSKFLKNPKDTKIRIEVVFRATTVSIVVNDWFVGSYSLIEYGQ